MSDYYDVVSILPYLVGTFPNAFRVELCALHRNSHCTPYLQRISQRFAHIYLTLRAIIEHRSHNRVMRRFTSHSPIYDTMDIHRSAVEKRRKSTLLARFPQCFDGYPSYRKLENGR